MCVAGMPGMCIPANICNTWAQEPSGIDIPVSICTTCVCSRIASNVHSCQHLQHLGSGGFWNTHPCQHSAPHVCGRDVWNVDSCQHLQHLGSGALWNRRSCKHLHHTCVARMSGMPIAFAAPGLRSFLELASLPAFAPHVWNVWNAHSCQHLQHGGSGAFWN